MTELEAAQRRQLLTAYAESLLRHCESDGICDADEVAAVCEDWIREHPADDSELLDEAWLRSVGAIERNQNFRDHKPFDLGAISVEAFACPGPECWAWELYVFGHRIKSRPTRGDVRLLASALGIPLTAQEQNDGNQT